MMLRRVGFAATVLLLAQALLAAAQGPVLLQWQFKEGDKDKFYIEEKTVSKTTVKVAGMAIDQDQTAVKVSQIIVKSRTVDGVVLEQRIESFNTKMVMMGNTIEPAKEIEDLLKNVVFTIHLSSNGKLTKFEGYDQFIKNVDKASADAGDEQKAMEMKMFKAVLTEEALSAGSSYPFSVLPNKAVNKGESWKREQSASMGPLGNFKLGLNLTYKGPADGGMEKVDITGEMSYEAPKADGPDLGFKIAKVDLNQKKLTGSLLFDTKAKRVSSLELNTVLGGSMTIEVGGMQTQVDLEGTSTQTVRVLEKRP
jgi:hypothetical protein